MKSMKDYVSKIIDWYLKNKRELPWRMDKDPYHVWISEIMLQQTRIEAVLNYYQRFMETLPTIHDLAIIEEDQLLKLWQGLGYYNRARNLQEAAVKIDELGYFPNTYNEIMKLPGIGEYTASAISSICFNEKKATVDGNVMRIYTRFYNDSSNISKQQTKKKIREELEKIIPSSSGDFNEGLMELGERICIPNGLPKCEECPLREGCLANQKENYFSYPVKDEKKEKEIIPLTVFILIWENKTYIRKRTEEGLLNNLFEFPNVVGTLTEKEIAKVGKEYGTISKIEKSIEYTHIFTHKKWKMQAYFIELKETPIKDSFLSLSLIEEKYALPTAFQVFFDELKKTIQKF